MKPFDFKNEKYHLGHLFFDAMRTRPDAICQIDAATGESETNASVLRRSIQLAQCLRRFGAQPGDVLALGGRNHLDLDIAFYAALLNGMPIAGVDPMFKYAELKLHFQVSSPRVAFCQKEHLDVHSRVCSELQLNTELICFDDDEHSLKSFIKQYYDDCIDNEEFTPLEFDTEYIYAFLVSTGGTTGVFKIAAHKHKAILAKLPELQKMVLRSENIPEDSLGIHLSPVQWISSYFDTITYPSMHLTKIMTSAPPSTEHVIDIINKYKPAYGSLSPTLLRSILKNEKYCDFTCFENIIVGGSKFSLDVYTELKNRLRLGATVTEIYGQTENFGPVLIPNVTGPIGNCGKAIDNWHYVKLVEPDTGKEITESFVNGEMWTKGATFTEYYKNPEETARVFTDDGWYRTGDLLYKDRDGNYFYVERLSMLMKCRNYQIIPLELEAVIREHSGIYDVIVTSIPHEEDGEQPVACVVKKPGSDVTAQEIKDIVLKKLSDTRQLRGGVVFLDELPLTSTGKVARGKLRQMVLTAQRE